MKTHLDLFSGIGGFALACRWNNIQTVGFVEYEDYPRRILGEQFPGVPLFGDIRDFDATPFRGVDLITGGYPCQPFSQAGKRKGKEDVRHLWPEMLRVVIEAQPTYLIIENVAGFINLALDTVCADLEAEDYTTGTVVLGAASVNAPHRRQRIWCLAKRLGNPNGERFQEQQVCVQQGRQDQPRSEITRSGPDVAHSQCQSVRDQRCSGNAGPEGKGEKQGKKRQRVWTDVSDEGGNGSADRSIFKSNLGRRTDGLSAGLDFPRRWGDGTWEDGVPRVTTERKHRTARLKALGNAIVPQIAYELIRCIKEIDESE